MQKDPVIKTERLLLRSVCVEDAASIFEYRSDPDVNYFQNWVPTSIEEVRDFTKNKVASEINVIGTWFQFVILKKDDQKIIGDVGVHFLSSCQHQVEIGCTIAKSEQAKGYATEALKEIIQYLFNKLNKYRVIASIDPRNTNSIKLVKKLGLRKEAHFIKSIFMKGEWVDDLVYAILKEE